ncbi:branched-chain amino acid ABC transporter substrate-binding protein [Psychromonas sp.]|uniref:branched-chain amino acid ABC transporter substrate-binding protein n=1 Tax=Psychromonas sp. TaxID=1884585 RepID=UPI003567D944
MLLSNKAWRNRFGRKHISGAFCRLSIFSVAFLGLTLATVSRQTKAEEAVTVAIAAPMVGNSFSIGIQYNAGVTAAIDALPGGLLLGRKLHIKTYDDKCSTPIAEKVAEDLVLDPPAVVIGHSCSMATIAAAPVYARHNILQITPASTQPKVTEMGIKTIFRMIGRDDVQGEIAAQRIAKRHPGEKVGVFYFPGGYSVELARTAMDALEKQGIKAVHTAIGIASASSYAEDIQDFIDAEVDVLYLVGGGLDSGVFVRQVKQMDAPFDIISSDTLVSKVFIETAGSAGEDIPFTFPPEASELFTATQAVAALKKQGEEPAGYTLFAYAATQTWIEGVRRANSFDTNLVAAAIRQAPIETVLGRVSFDMKGDIHTNYPAFSWYTWKRGKRVSVD